MPEEHFQVNVNDRDVTAIRILPAKLSSGLLFIYAPGAGSNIDDLFGSYLSQRLFKDRIGSVRFQFPYMQDGRRRPDSPALLEETWGKVIATFKTPSTKLVVGGRSMGGRIASHVVAQGIQADGLALFAYPLHSPSNPSKWRDAHLPEITVPTIFCSGTRDAFATGDELVAAASKTPGATVNLLDGADHGFAVLKSSGRTKGEVWDEAASCLISWFVDQGFTTRGSPSGRGSIVSAAPLIIVKDER